MVEVCNYGKLAINDGHARMNVEYRGSVGPVGCVAPSKQSIHWWMLYAVTWYHHACCSLGLVLLLEFHFYAFLLTDQKFRTLHFDPDFNICKVFHPNFKSVCDLHSKNIVF